MMSSNILFHQKIKSPTFLHTMVPFSRTLVDYTLN